MAAVRLRRLWLKLHRWVGLSLGMLLLISATTGTLLILGEPIDEALRPTLYRAQEVGDGKLDPVLEKLRTEFGNDASFTFRPPREPGETLHVFVSGPWKGTVFFDPATGKERGRLGQTEGFFNTVFALHSTLLANQIGRSALAMSALGYILLLATGLTLWWPKWWRNALKVQTGFGFTRSLFDLHRVVGALMGLLVLMSIVTGVYMVWRPISAGVSAVAGSTPVRPPVIAEPVGQSRGTIDEAMDAASKLVPDGKVGYAQVPASGTQPVRIRYRVPDDPHPNGLTSVWMHPETLQVLAVHRWNELDTGTRAYSWIYPLHIGELGGRATWLMTLLSGVALIWMGVSGTWLWWRRRFIFR